MADTRYRILVTGASGFVGSALVPALAARGHQVRAAARHVQPAAGIEPATLTDITRPVDWAPLVEGIDIVVHLAGIAHRPGADPRDLDQANHVAVADLAAASRQAGVRHLVFISSIGAQSGSAADHVVTEADTPMPTMEYGRAKLRAEEALRASGMSFTILRPTLIYGPGPVANVAQLLRIARLPVPLPLGALTNRRSLLAVENLISAIVESFDNPRMRDEAYIVCDPQPIRFRDLIAVLRQADGRSPRLVPVPRPLLRAPLIAAGKSLMWDQIGRELVASPQKLIDAGWRPVVTTEQGIAAMARGTPARL